MNIFSNALAATEIITCFMEHNPPSEANRFENSHEITHISSNPTVHYIIHKCPPPVSNLNQLDPVHTTTSNFLKIHLNIILPSTSVSPHWCLSPTFPPCTRCSSPPHTLHAPPPPFHSAQSYHPQNIRRAVHVMMLFIR